MQAEVPADTAETIVRQQAEIERLQSLLKEDRFAKDLRDALVLASVTGTIGAVVSHNRLLRMIVATAADIIDAGAASLFLIDAEQEHLVFKGLLKDGEFPDRDEFTIPLDYGVAGLVVMTEQPVAISDAEDDVDAGDIAQVLGYSPRNLLCVPLSFQDRAIGVLQFMDKEGADSFSVDDMEAVSLFANLAGVAIEQSRTQSRMGALLAQLVESTDGIPDFDRNGLTERARTFTAQLGQQAGYLNALTLARLVQEIVGYGDDATEGCRGILASFAEFLRASPAEGEDRWARGW